MSAYSKIKNSLILIITLMVIASGVILWNQWKLQRAFTTMQMTVQVDQALLECRRQEKNYILRQDSTSLDEFTGSYQTLRRSITQLDSVLRSNGLPDSIKALLPRITQNANEYRNRFEQVRQSEPQTPTSLYHYEEVTSDLVQYARAIHRHVDIIRQAVKQRFESIAAASNVINIAAFIVGLFLSVLIAGYLIDQLRKD